MNISTLKKILVGLVVIFCVVSCNEGSASLQKECKEILAPKFQDWQCLAWVRTDVNYHGEENTGTVLYLSRDDERKIVIVK
jgi:hypothetical protein